MKDKTLHLFLINSILIILIWSGINPFDKFTWILEVLPAIIGGFVLIIIYSKFKFTNLVYILI
ncbi:sodium-glucose/galactose cotransporter [Clostridium tetani]|nr:sodium-glucose/galactose cotransporter [Clostridium tetani]